MKVYTVEVKHGMDKITFIAKGVNIQGIKPYVKEKTKEYFENVLSMDLKIKIKDTKIRTNNHLTRLLG